MFDVYRDTKDPSLRMAVLPGAGLPTHLDALEKHLHRTNWELMSAGSSELYEDAAGDIEARGFCFFQLVEVDLSAKE